MATVPQAFFKRSSGVPRALSEAQITDNLLSLVDAVVRAKPTGAKGTYVKLITLTSTMSPGIHMDVPQTLSEAAGAARG
jgi:hypothetical protein